MGSTIQSQYEKHVLLSVDHLSSFHIVEYFFVLGRGNAHSCSKSFYHSLFHLHLLSHLCHPFFNITNPCIFQSFFFSDPWPFLSLFTECFIKFCFLLKSGINTVWLNLKKLLQVKEGKDILIWWGSHNKNGERNTWVEKGSGTKIPNRADICQISLTFVGFSLDALLSQKLLCWEGVPPNRDYINS